MTDKLGGPDSVVGRQMAEKTRQRRRELFARGATYGIIDPDYARIFTIARKLAWDEGYALAMHGSFTRDLDLIAVPWTEKACDPEHLVERIMSATGTKHNGHPPGDKPHGRRAWTLLLPTFGDPRFVDLSVMPRTTFAARGAEAAPVSSDQQCRDAVCALLRLRYCLSYNDSYCGEPAGDVKRAVADWERAGATCAPTSGRAK